MNDNTEMPRRIRTAIINGAVESNSPDDERERLEKIHGQVWTTEEMAEEFIAEGFGSPFVVVRRKSDNVKGSLEFQHMPRFYFNFQPL